MSESTVTVGTGTQVKAHVGIVTAIKTAQKAIAATGRKVNRLYLDICEMVIKDNVSQQQLIASYIEGGYKDTTARTTASRVFLLTRPGNRETFEKVRDNKMTVRAALAKMQSENPREGKKIQEILIGRFESTALNIVFKDGLEKPRCTENDFMGWAQKAYRNVFASLEEKAEAKAERQAKKHEKVNVKITEVRKSGRTETHREETKTDGKKAA